MTLRFYRRQAIAALLTSVALACSAVAALAQNPGFVANPPTYNPLRTAAPAAAPATPPPAPRTQPPASVFSTPAPAPTPVAPATSPAAIVPPETQPGYPAVVAKPETPPVQPPAATNSTPAAIANATASGTEQLTLAEVETRRKQAEETPDLADDVKKKIADLYRQAAEHIGQAEQQAASAANLKAAAETVPARVAQLRSELEALQNATAQAPQVGSLAELEQRLAATDLQLKELKTAQPKLEAEPAARAARRKELRTLLTSAPQRREDLGKQLDAAPPADEPPTLTLARRTEALTNKLFLEKQTPVLQAELAKYDAEEASDLLRLQRDILARKVVLAQREFELANDAVSRQREADARDAVRQAQEEVINAQPVLKTYAEENQRFAEEAATLATAIGETETKLKTARTRLEGVQKQMTQTQTKVENVGLTGAIGLMLRKQRTELPDVRRRRQNVADRQAEIDTVQLALYEYDDQRSDLSTPEPIVARIVASAGAELTPDERRRLREATEHVLLRKREYLDTLIRNYGSYFDSMVELDTTERQLINVTEEYQTYIDERVLWIRSARPLYADFRLDDADYEIANAEAWQAVGTGLAKDFQSHFFAYVFAGVIFATLLAWNLRIRSDISKQGDIAERGNCREFLPTIRTACLTLMLVLPWPGLMCFVAWRLQPLAGREGLACGLANGLMAVAMTYFLLRATRELCRPGGLGESHFDWPVRATRQMRAGLRMLVVFGLPLVSVTATLKGLDSEHGSDVIERCAMILSAAILITFMGRQFSPTSGVFKEYLAENAEGWLSRLKQVWYWSLLAAPAMLAGLSLFGYHYTARQLAARLYITATLVLVAIVARSMMLRLVLIARRKLAMAEASRRREQQLEAATADGATAQTTPPTVPDPPQVDLKTHSAQIQSLVATGLVAATLIGMWSIWSGVVPALGFLDRFALWSSTVSVTEQVVGATGEAIVTTTDKIMTVTLADVMLATIITIVTFVAARNAPGLLEFSVLRRLPLENSVRYAITTLASYAIIMIGIIVGCQTIGVGWSQVQWLATALTFGLAFGLQEMFANFIAGLIILFERPVRVGDIVTIDDTTGIISKIRIRATTITNWEQKEYIVPNKEFITGKVLNWTLSDQVHRLSVKVGVAYGSDTKLVHELLLKVAAEHPLILKDPPTIATFEGFGDSCLDFCLRAFLARVENRLQVIHELHMAIDAAFREGDVEISFPQRDLHIRSLSPAIAALTQAGEQNDERREAA